MTHEYVIATNGAIHAAAGPDGRRPTALAWAFDYVLAVGADDAVRSVSRGDSTFIDLGGCAVTALPADFERAHAMVAAAAIERRGGVDVGGLLVAAGLLDEGAFLEPGSRADLAVWGIGPPGRPGRVPDDVHSLVHGPGLVAVVRGGAFTDGDEHRGPFSPPDLPAEGSS